MSRRRGGVMSERLKYELADELGVGDVVRRDGGYFGNVSSKTAVTWSGLPSNEPNGP